MYLFMLIEFYISGLFELKNFMFWMVCNGILRFDFYYIVPQKSLLALLSGFFDLKRSVELSSMGEKGIKSIVPESFDIELLVNDIDGKRINGRRENYPYLYNLYPKKNKFIAGFN